MHINVQSVLSLLSQGAITLQDPLITGNPDVQQHSLKEQAASQVGGVSIPYKDAEVVISITTLPFDLEIDSQDLDIAVTGGLSVVSAPNMCNAPCNEKCVNFNRPGPSYDDCNALGNWISGQCQTFLSPANTNTSISYGSCSSYLLNLSYNDYEFCCPNWGNVIYGLTSSCMPSYNGASCLDQPYQWGIELSGPGA